MQRTLRFLLVLVAGLGLLAAAGYFALASITRSWFEADMELRSRLAVTSAGRTLDRRWGGDRHELTETLTDITRDERIMAAAACSPTGETLASTEAYPSMFTCESIRGQSGDSRAWTTTADLPSGRVHVTAVPVGDGPTHFAVGIELENQVGGSTPVLVDGFSISDFDVESSKLINGGAEWSEIQAFFVDKTDDVLAAYDDAIATNPDVADDLTTLRDYTDGIDEIAAEAAALADLGAKLAEVPGVTEAGQAGLALNEYAQTNCGFSTGGN